MNNISQESLERTQDYFKKLRILSNRLVLDIIQYLDSVGESSVNDILFFIKRNYRTHQSVISSYLKKMRDTKLVVSERRGKQVFYKINTEVFNLISKSIEQYNGL